MSDRVAVLGGAPRFSTPVPIVRPATAPRVDAITESIRAVLASGEITNGRKVRELEERAAEMLGVAEVAAVSSCTLALALGIRAAGLAGTEVLLPAFTIAATATAALWNGCTVRYVDVDPDTFTIDPGDLAAKRTERTGLVIGVHLFGTPCAVERVQAAAGDVPVVFDAAQALGASWRGRRVGGFGRFEVFSASPSKHFTMVEGGFVATDDRDLARRVRLARNYGVDADYHVELVGLNARLSELHAAVGLSILDDVDGFIKNRNASARLYRELLGDLPGVGFQRVPAEASAAFNYFGVTFDPDAFGLDNRELMAALAAEGVQTKIYYQAPLHREPALGGSRDARLPVTDRLAARMLCLPLYNEMDAGLVEQIAAAVRAIHHNARAVRDTLAARARKA
jgi:dTDP-4-amino-4,6-dideoxygalactose transaminase